MRRLITVLCLLGLIFTVYTRPAIALVLDDNDILTIDVGNLYEEDIETYEYSTIFFLGGAIDYGYQLLMYDDSSLHFSGGFVEDVIMNERSYAEFSGGELEYLELHDDGMARFIAGWTGDVETILMDGKSTINVSGVPLGYYVTIQESSFIHGDNTGAEYVKLEDNSSIMLSHSRIGADDLRADDNSVAYLSDVEAYDHVYAEGESWVYLSEVDCQGGGIFAGEDATVSFCGLWAGDYPFASGNSMLNLYGGESDPITITDNAIVNIYGQNLQAAQDEFNPELHYISGIWADGTAVDLDLEVSASAQFNLYPVSAIIDNILERFDTFVADGTLYGNGHGISPDAPMNAFRNMIGVAKKHIDAGKTEKACKQLQKCYDKCDGETPPADIISGPAAPGLAWLIQATMRCLGCQ